AVAVALRTLLERPARSPCSFRRGGQMLTKPSLTLKRRIKAPPAQVFAAWTDPKKIVHWFGPSDTVAGSVRADMDVRTGGRYKMNFQTANGERHQVGGVYREIVPASRLVFTWAWQSTPE